MKAKNYLISAACMTLLSTLSGCKKPVSCGDEAVVAKVLRIVESNAVEGQWDGVASFIKESKLIVIKDPIVKALDEKVGRIECKATVVLPLSQENKAKIDMVVTNPTQMQQVMLRWQLYFTSLNAMEYLALPRLVEKSMQEGDQELVELAKDRLQKFGELHGNSSKMMIYNLMEEGALADSAEEAADALEPLLSAFAEYDKSKSSLRFPVNYKIETVDNEEGRTKVSASWNNNDLEQMVSLMGWFYAHQQWQFAQSKIAEHKAVLATAPASAPPPASVPTLAPPPAPVVKTEPVAKAQENSKPVAVPPPSAEPVNSAPPTASITHNPSPTQAIAPVIKPSFDCAKAKGAVESLICQDAELAKLDLELSLAYKSALTSSQNPAQLKSEQLDWMRGQRNQCANLACLKREYTARVQALSEQ